MGQGFGHDLVAVAAEFRVGKRAPHIVGASLGGLGAIVGAGILEPSAFASVTLVDITPNMEAGGVAKIIGFMGEHSADGFASLDEAADVIAQYMPYRPRPQDLGARAYERTCLRCLGRSVQSFSTTRPLH